MALRDLHEYAEEVRRTFRFDHCSAFIKVAERGPDPLLGIAESEGCRAINEKYLAGNIYRCDPFMSMVRNAELDRSKDVFALMTPDSPQSGADIRRFWNFMTQNEMVEAGASRRRVADGVDIVIGLHRRRDPLRRAVDEGALRASLSVFHDLIVRQMLSRMLDAGGCLGAIQSMAISPSAPPGKLSPQEMRIASLVKAGKRNKEIAYLLAITENTVEGHLRTAFRKMKVNNRISLISALDRYN